MGEFLAVLQSPEGKEKALAVLPFVVGGLLALVLVLAAWLRPLLRFSLVVAGAATLLAMGIWRDEFGEVMFNAAML
jgi:hypothetical protein